MVSKRFIWPVLTFVTVFAIDAAGLSPITTIQPLAAANVANLGNLSRFRTIARDASVLVDKGDLANANVRIKELEKLWDDAAPALKQRSPADWYAVDNAIDVVLTAFRASPADKKACEQALSSLLDVIQKSGTAKKN